MKAIETVYRGYRFRSRLEARWAVFFDTLGVKWEYEPEGFSLPSGPYLPDFFVYANEDSGSFKRHGSGTGYWVEIKPVWPSDRERAMALDLANETNHTCYIVVGPPMSGPILYANRGQADLAKEFLADCGNEIKLWLAGFVAEGMPDDKFYVSSRKFDQSVAAARQARFEHGQVGAPHEWAR
jgi:hypothetical protein